MVDADTFRKLAGSFPSGVTIVTSGEEGSFHAMTASAFTSLSLDPPMVLVCVDKRAASAEIIANHGRFAVNVLACGQEAISNACAKRGTPESSLEGIDYREGALGLPLIECCLAAFECCTMHAYEGGDHIIFAGQVESGSVGQAVEPLLYFRGAYGAFACPDARK